jgi:hypothetical protein
MTDERPTDAEPLDDEFHSSLEVDDSSGWRVFIVPGVLLLFLLGAVLFIVFSQGETGPDPRIADRLKNEAAAQNATEPVAAPATVPLQPTNTEEMYNVAKSDANAATPATNVQ